MLKNVQTYMYSKNIFYHYMQISIQDHNISLIVCRRCMFACDLMFVEKCIIRSVYCNNLEGLGKIGFFKFQISCFQKPDMCWKCYLERRYPYMIIPIKKKKFADQKSKVLTRVKWTSVIIQDHNISLIVCRRCMFACDLMFVEKCIIRSVYCNNLEGLNGNYTCSFYSS
jgi:hypothetical protein